MLRIILGVIVGFVVWSVLWVGSDLLLMAALPAWYFENVTAFEQARQKGESFNLSSTILILSLVRSVIFSIIAGFVAALIARETAKSTLALGILLLVVGILVQASVWSLIPLWYHLAFLILLIPATILGGKLRSS